ncbi:SDR family NAD(P)-dependent oxidoreductase [Streptomonospora wellingtoniae]|uniref:SDR family oxidoreductase n=1 Tax=Streptomonospora wellingtoniae TaxID=3075544 RepID=A0ABU2L0V1_9ACTN|nr:SDR family oxidoreductase [Streptomonospora sp. DSM 45055]MDT0304963.1 SDR family oxidoreductase [Streptomonospora sp. DSM 45055]
MRRSYVVTGAGRGIGRAVAERLVEDGGAVVAVDADERALQWAADRPRFLAAVSGDAAEEAVAEAAADAAERFGALGGWVNNAAVFRDADLHATAPARMTELITANLAPVVTGCAVAVRRFLGAGAGGAIVNVSSHQAQRPVPGAMAYASAKAAVEGLTRAVAVDYGPHGVRANALALGSVATERYALLLAGREPGEALDIREQLARLHPLGRVGEPEEVADAVAYLLGDGARFLTGAVVPLDGGRSVRGHDPEEA